MISDASLVKACDEIFESELGKKVYSDISRCINDFGMLPKLESGCVLGLSGGADSVLLLIFLVKFKKSRNFKLKAVHVNHMIRGEEADRDEEFSRRFSHALNVEFDSHSYDVPKIAGEKKCGTEEAARNVRYETFESYAKQGYPTVITAHNATDNLETFIFNFMRGTGITGLTAIAPVRENIVRPLLYVSKEDIVNLLSECDIPFCVDKTNASTEYTRNYIRHEVLPKLKSLTPSPENSASRAIENLRCDSEFIESYSEKVFLENFQDSKIGLDVLRSLHKAVFCRVIRLMVEKKSSVKPEKIHFDAIYDALRRKTDFEIDLPGNMAFYADGSFCYVNQKTKLDVSRNIHVVLNDGFTEVPEFNIAIALSSDKSEDFSSNVYNFSMKADLSSAIIVGELYIRTKADGDAYRYGGITRKLKKLFNDKKIPISKRDKIPVICDDKGIVWVPGFGVRDDEPQYKTEKWLTVYKKLN